MDCHAELHARLIVLLSLGTPISTGLLDLENQLKFLGIEHLGCIMGRIKRTTALHVNDKTICKQHSYSEMGTERCGGFAFLLRALLMRHSHEQRYHGTNTTLMSLPAKVGTCHFADESKRTFLSPIITLIERTSCFCRFLCAGQRRILRSRRKCADFL